MNEQYLWDKTGSDTDIEDLENVLALYRYQETAAPIFVQDPVKERRPAFAWLFTLKLAFGALAIALFSLTIWLVGSKSKTANKEVAVATPAVSPTSDQKSATAVIPSDSPILPAAPQPNPAIVRTADRSNMKPKKTFVAIKQKVQKREPIKLSNEERYAYNQLLLALSITGSKLRIVQDTINNNEDPGTAGKPNLK